MDFKSLEKNGSQQALDGILVTNNGTIFLDFVQVDHSVPNTLLFTTQRLKFVPGNNIPAAARRSHRLGW
jgi:hypothetical protein